MSRKVKVATTKRRRTLHGSVTNHYRYQDKGRVAYYDDGRPSKKAQVARWSAQVTGVHPWRPLRFALFLGIVALGNGSWAALPAFAAAAAIWWWQHRPEPVVPAPRPVVLPGPAWCDHCADWTVHPTERHRVAA